MSKRKKRRTGNRSDYWRVCGKKKKYSTPKSAQFAIEKAQRERNVDLYVYDDPCPYCGKWHIAEKVTG